MGNQPCDSEERTTKNMLESWKYEGDIYQKIIDNKTKLEQYIKICSLTGKIIIKKVNEKKGIDINGKIKGAQKQKYIITGKEIEKPKELYGDEKLIFMIDKGKNFQLNDITITKYNGGIAKLSGNNVYLKDNNRLKGPFFLDLELKNHMEYNNQAQTPYVGKVNKSIFELSKIMNKKSPEDILMNSLCGMKNLINTCYINSSFQILIHIPKFIKIIREQREFEYGIIKLINDIFEQILMIYKEYNPVINPESFVDYFKSNHYMYNNYSQMDSEMFLEELIWDINIELGNLNIGRDNILFNKNNKNEREEDFLNYIEESENETHFEINDLFYVYFINEKKCVFCKNISYYFDESPGLKLNFEHTKYQSKIDLVSLIMDNFKQPITIKSRILCQYCQNCYYFEETTRIAKLPEILILSLQKVNKENTKKIPWIVEFKERIGIREIVDRNLVKESCLYEIFAINNHLGNTPKSGHYFSQINLKDLKSWYSFNDECVENDSDWSNPKLYNYILFYKQIRK